MDNEKGLLQSKRGCSHAKATTTAPFGRGNAREGGSGCPTPIPLLGRMPRGARYAIAADVRAPAQHPIACAHGGKKSIQQARRYLFYAAVVRSTLLFFFWRASRWCRRKKSRHQRNKVVGDRAPFPPPGAGRRTFSTFSGRDRGACRGLEGRKKGHPQHRQRVRCLSPPESFLSRKRKGFRDDVCFPLDPCNAVLTPKDRRWRKKRKKKKREGRQQPGTERRERFSFSLVSTPRSCWAKGEKEGKSSIFVSMLFFFFMDLFVPMLVHGAQRTRAAQMRGLAFSLPIHKPSLFCVAHARCTHMSSHADGDDTTAHRVPPRPSTNKTA